MTPGADQGPFAAFLASPEAHALPLPPARLAAACEAGFAGSGHGDLPRWRAAIEGLPALKPAAVAFDRPAVTVTGPATTDERQALRASLGALAPWRKGPFDLFGVVVDSEWQSWMKWSRLAGRVDFRNCRVLDVGCGNGYYGWRLLGAGASSVVGIDPTPLYVAQFLALQRLIGPSADGTPRPNWVLPLAAEALTGSAAYDRVLSLGVLYHRKAPLAHLADLRRWCAPGGQVVVETLVVDGDEQTVLTPRDRYAAMRNVWYIPSAATLRVWLERAGLREPVVIDATPTTLDEQRSTAWMTSRSLPDFLDPDDPRRTVEGYPAPCRAIAVARR